MKESRMDRIEKGLEEFFRIVMEDRAANAELRASIAELKESQKKTDEQQKKTDEQQRKTDEQQRKTDEQLQKTDKQLRATIKKLDDVGNTLGNMGVIDGKVAEDLFYRNVRHAFRQKNIAFSDVRRNVKKKGIAEYDIVAVNGDRILVVEVKKKMERHMVDEFLNEKLPKFRQVFPEYRDSHLIGGVGALVMQDEIGRYAEKKGLYVLTQNGDGGAMLINRQDFMAKEF